MSKVIGMTSPEEPLPFTLDLILLADLIAFVVSSCCLTEPSLSPELVEHHSYWKGHLKLRG